jgi:hypothetical protein
MGKHLIAFSQSQNPTAFTRENFVTDVTVTPIGTTLVQVPPTNLIVASYGYGTILTRYQIQTPSLKANRVPIEIDTVDATATTASSTIIGGNGAFQFFNDTPVALNPGESLEVDVITTGGTAAQSTIGLWLDNGLPDTIVASAGTYLPGVRATSSTTLTANAWTACSLTFDNTLPVGTYAIVGMVAESATGLLARVAVPGYAWRMGVICQLAATNAIIQRPEFFRHGRFGTYGQGVYHAWGGFVSTSPPQVEFLALAADSAETVLFDLVKVA